MLGAWDLTSSKGGVWMQRRWGGSGCWLCSELFLRYSRGSFQTQFTVQPGHPELSRVCKSSPLCPAPAFLSWDLSIHPTHYPLSLQEKWWGRGASAELKMASVRDQFSSQHLITRGTMILSDHTDLGDQGVLFLKVLYVFTG